MLHLCTISACSTFSNQVTSYGRKATAMRTSRIKATSSWNSKQTTIPNITPQNSGSTPPTTNGANHSHNSNLWLHSLKTQQHTQQPRHGHRRYPCTYINYSPEETGCRRSGISIQQYKSQHAALPRIIAAAHDEDDGTRDSTSFAGSNYYRRYKVSHSGKTLLYNINNYSHKTKTSTAPNRA